MLRPPRCPCPLRRPPSSPRSVPAVTPWLHPPPPPPPPPPPRVPFPPRPASPTIVPAMIELGVNIDHVATLRQARRTYEPDPVWAAVEAELGGADGITVHLREDRRHITDRDVEVLRQTVQCKLNLEMSLAAEIVEIAARTVPDQATLVPEKRQEVTTE